MLRWDLENATQGAYLYWEDQEKGVVAPGSERVTPEHTTIYRLVARNDLGSTERQLTISVVP